MLTILSFFLCAGIISLYLRWPSEVMSFGSLLSYWKLLGSFKTYLNYNSLSIIHLETYRAKSSFLSFFLTQYSFSSKNIYMTMHKMAKRLIQVWRVTFSEVSTLHEGPTHNTRSASWVAESSSTDSAPTKSAQLNDSALNRMIQLWTIWLRHTRCD